MLHDQSLEELDDENGEGQLLIVDEQIFNVLAIRSQLTVMGVQCVSANSGERAIELFNQRLSEVANGTQSMFKLILLTKSMDGEMQGSDIAKSIRNNFATFQIGNPTVSIREPYLVCLTGLTRSREKQDRAETKAYQVDCFLHKPISFDDLKFLMLKTKVLGAPTTAAAE